MTIFQDYRRAILEELDRVLLPLGYTRKKAIYALPVEGGFYTVELERHLKSPQGLPVFTVTVQVFSRIERESLGLHCDPFRSGIVSDARRPENPDWVPVPNFEAAHAAAKYFSEFLRGTGFSYLPSRHGELRAQYGY